MFKRMPPADFVSVGGSFPQPQRVHKRFIKKLIA